jgi:hypothetical protein
MFLKIFDKCLKYNIRVDDGSDDLTSIALISLISPIDEIEQEIEEDGSATLLYVVEVRHVKLDVVFKLLTDIFQDDDVQVSIVEGCIVLSYVYIPMINSRFYVKESLLEPSPKNSPSAPTKPADEPTDDLIIEQVELDPLENS